MNHGQHEAASQSIRKRHELELAGPFIAVLFALALISFILPLRPETSVREKRRLREFPPFTMESLLSGEYFDGISLWFSDTFPGREGMLEVSDRMNALHGLNRGVQDGRLVQSGNAHVHVEDMRPGLRLRDGLAQDVRHVSLFQRRAELLLSSWVDALSDYDCVV